MHLRKALDSSHNQVLIWKEIEKQLDSGKFKNNSLAYLSRGQDKKYTFAGDEYFRWFRDRFREKDSTIVGFVAVSGDKIIGSDIFAGRNLFYQQLEPLLKGYIDEAVLFGAPPRLKDPPVQRDMGKLLKDEKKQEEFVRKKGKIFLQHRRVGHVKNFVKDPYKNCKLLLT